MAHRCGSGKGGHKGEIQVTGFHVHSPVETECGWDAPVETAMVCLSQGYEDAGD